MEGFPSNERVIASCKNVTVTIGLCPYFITIDNLEIGMDEDCSMGLQFIENLAYMYEIHQNNDVSEPAFTKIGGGAYYDYVEFGMMHLDRNTVEFISEFYDHTDRVTGTCDATAFYTAFMDASYRWILRILAEPNIRRNYHSWELWPQSYEKLAPFILRWFGYEAPELPNWKLQ